MAYFKLSGRGETTLAVGINNSVTSLTVTDGSVFPATGDFILTIVEGSNFEDVLATARSGNSVTVTRAYAGSTAQSFGANAVVFLGIRVEHIEELQDEIDTKQDIIVDSDDITEGTAKLFLTVAERTKLSNTSGTNTGDQDLSPYFNKSSDDTDDITEGATKKFATASEKTKLGHITVTQAVDLDTIESDTATNNAKVSNATHTGDVTGATGLTAQPAIITGKPSATVAGGDLLLIADINDSNALKQVTAQSIADLGGGSYTNEQAQDAVGGILTDTTSIDAIYDDAGNTISFQREALTGDVTASKNSNTTTIANNAVTTAKIADDNVTFAKIENISADHFLGRHTSGSGDVQQVSATQARTILNVENGAEVNTVDSVAGKTGVVSLDKSDVGLGNVNNTTDLNKPISTATQTALDGKVSKTGDQIEGTFTNSEPFTQVILHGSATGNNSQGQPLTNTSPRIELGTHQYSEYRSGEEQKGGYSEIIRLKNLDPLAKATQAWYDHEDNPTAWIVAHFQPQDLRRYATLAAFPVTGVDDGLRAYFAEDTEKYYTWNGSGYTELLTTNSQYYFRAIHQHISTETSDSTKTALYTRLAIPYGLDVVPITTSNAHFRITGGFNNGVEAGAFIVDNGKMFSLNPIILYPNSANAATVETWKDDPTDNIFANNTEGLRIRVLAAGNADNLVSGQRMISLNGEGVSWLGIAENLVIGGATAVSVGINRSAGVTLDVRRGLGVANNTEYTIQRISRDESSFLNIGYRGDGSGVGSYMIRPTGSKSLVLGTTGNNTALIINGTTGNITIAVEIISPKIRASSSAGIIIEANNGTDVVALGVGNTANSTFYGAVQVPDDAYDATSWNGNTTVPTKNAIRDKIESMSAGSGITRSIVVSSGNFTAGASAATDYIYLLSGAHTATQPTAVGNTNLYTYKNYSGSDRTINTTSSQTIDGTTTITIANEDSVTLFSDGSNWFII